jgi:hypothetical protein
MGKKYKDSEVCHENLRQKLSMDTGISRFEEVEVSIEDVKGSFYVRDKDQDYYVSKSMAKGGVPCLRTIAPPHTQEVLLIDRPWDKVFKSRERSVEEFGVDITIEKNAYKQCEGGGWYTIVDIYNYNSNKYYWVK